MLDLRPLARLCLASLITLASLTSPLAAQEAAPADTPAAFRVYLPALSSAGSPQAGRPTIQSFSAGPATIAPGGAATLSWSVSGAAAISISPGVGAVTGSSVVVRPSATTSYTLTATNAAGSATATASVVVEAPAPGANPLTIGATPDKARAATKAIGPDGGELSASGANGVSYRLSIPAGSLAFTETITLTPAAASGLPFAAGSLGAVSVEPAGLFLAEPATLSISAAAPAGARPLGYAYDGAGAEFHLHPLGGPPVGGAELAAPGGITMQTQVLRGYGATAGTPAEISAQAAGRAPSSPLDRADQEVAADLRAEAFARVRDDFSGRILPLMRSAETNADLADRALEEWGRWRGFVARHAFADQLRDEIATGDVRVPNILKNATRRSSGRCLSDGRVEEGFALLRWLHYTRKFLPGAPIADIQGALERCLRFKVTFHSIIEASHPADYGFRYEVKSTLNLRWVGGMRLTGAAQLDFVAMDWFGGTDCEWQAQRVGSYFEAREEGQGLTIAPVSRTSPQSTLSFTYDPGEPSERVTILCGGAPVVLPETFGWKTYYGDMHGDERSPAGYTASARVNRIPVLYSWTYLRGGQGSNEMNISEETTIDLLHTPAR